MNFDWTFSFPEKRKLICVKDRGSSFAVNSHAIYLLKYRLKQIENRSASKCNILNTAFLSCILQFSKFPLRLSDPWVGPILSQGQDLYGLHREPHNILSANYLCPRHSSFRDYKTCFHTSLYSFHSYFRGTIHSIAAAIHQTQATYHMHQLFTLKFLT